MNKNCDFCDERLLDGEDIAFVGESTFHLIPSKVNFAISKYMDVQAIYHRLCLKYVLGGGR